MNSIYDAKAIMIAQKSGFKRILSVAELGHAVATSVKSQEDMHNLRLVCRRLNELITPFIYRSLHLCLSSEEFLFYLEFIDYLKARPLYLSMVHEISVTFGSKAFTHTSVRRKSKEFRYRCLLVVDLVQKVSCLRNFRWQAQDTIPEELLDALDFHPNRPSLELQQCLYAGHQRFPPFLRIASMTFLKALRVKIDFAYYHASWVFGLLKGVFEVINKHLKNLEELELTLEIPITGNPESPRADWNILRSTNLTESLIKQAIDSGGCFSSLRLLNIQANIPIFGIDGDKPLGLNCLLHYAYPVIRELRLDFPDLEPFLGQLSKFSTFLRHLHCNISSESRWQESSFALSRFLEGCGNLRACSISAKTSQAIDLRPFLTILFGIPARDMLTLAILASSNTDASGDQIEFLYRFFEKIDNSLPYLSHLELRTRGSQDLEELVNLTKKFRLRTLILHPPAMGWSLTQIPAENEVCQSGPFQDQKFDGKFGHMALSIFGQSTTLHDIIISEQPEYPAPDSFYLGIPTYRYSKNVSTGKVICHNLLHEVQERSLKRWANRLGEEYPNSNAQNAETEKRRMKLALFPAYRNIIDAWEAD